MFPSQFHTPSAERSAIAGAFAALDGQDQVVLWYASVERLPLSAAAQQAGVPLEVMRQCVVQARAAFRSAWVELHYASTRVEPSCSHAAHQIQLANAGLLTKFEQDGLDSHLVQCLRCAILMDEVEHLDEHLTDLLPPLLYGPSAAAITKPTTTRSTTAKSPTTKPPATRALCP